MSVLYTNNAKTTLSASLNNSATSLSVASSSGFPSLSGSHYFYATLDDNTNLEVVKVTAVSGTTWTVVRGQDNTSATAFSSGDTVELRLNAALLTDVVNDALASSFTRQDFTGNGSTTAFTLNKTPGSENDLIVFIEGVFQNQADYTLSGTTLTFDEAPASNRKIVVYHVSASVSGDSLALNTFSGDGSTTAFTMSVDPLYENNTMVFIDGVYQNKSTYSTSGTTLTFDAAPANGTAIDVTTHTQATVNVPVDGSVSTAKLAADAVTGAKIADDAIDSEHYTDGSIDTAHIGNLQVTTAKLAADAVTAAKLADDAVVTANITDDAVTTAKVADDQITLAKLAGLARGKIIYGDASGNPAALALGSAGTVLTSDGTDISWAEEVAVNYLPLAGGTMTGNINLGDDDKAIFGVGSDLEIYHTATGNHSIIEETGGGNLVVRTNGAHIEFDKGSTEYMARMIPDGAVELYYDSAKKLETTSTGVEVNGGIRLSGLNGGDGLKFDMAGSGDYVIKESSTNDVMSFQGSLFHNFSNNRIGIGTASPSTKLEVSDANGVGLRFGDVASTPSSQTAGYIGMSTSAYSGNNGDLVLIPRTSVASKILLMEGKVGIGTTSPDTTLEVKHNDGAGNRQGLVGDGATTGSALWTNWTTGNSYLDFRLGGTSSAYTKVRLTSGGNLLVGTTSNSTGRRVHIESASGGYGQLGLRDSAATSGKYWRIGPNSSNNIVVTNQSGVGVYMVDGATSWTGTSDENLKENIVELTGALDKVKDFRCVEYNFIADKTKSKKIGFIAQDWQKDYSQVVSQNNDGNLGIQYTETIPVLLKAIQEQQTIIDDLKARIEKLES